MAKKTTTRSALHSSETNEWYTPKPAISIVRKTFGGYIELDPASNEVANEVIQAYRWFDEWDDGLKQNWIADNVFMNPPYGKDEETAKSNADLWIKKFLGEYELGHFNEGIILVNATPDVGWFDNLWDGWTAFMKSRIKFWRASGKAKQPTHGNVLTYFGEDPSEFIKAIGKKGHIVPPRELTQEIITKLAA